jgi:hypothetical protein
MLFFKTESYVGNLYWLFKVMVKARNVRIGTKLILPLSQNVWRYGLRADKFNLIYRKYVQHLCLQINLLKN